MKKFSSLALAALLLLSLVSCGDKVSSASEQEWTEQTIQAQFLETKEDGQEFLACVAADDRACDRVGVVLYEEDGEAITWVAYMDEEGLWASRCGVHARAMDDLQLTYCGDCVVTFRAQGADGTRYECEVTFTENESGNDHFALVTRNI